MTSDQAVRDHVLALLDGGQAHMSFDDAVADFPADKINVKPPNVPYTPWHLIEHLRRTQWDILDYTRNPDYKELNWPTDYWPEQDAKTDMAGWQKTIDQFQADLAEMRTIVADPKTNLTVPIAHGYGGHTVLREALLLADHNAYHIGELGILRQVMDAWPK
ncbi:MAG: DinB family protein [Chloroflexota bacterium]